MKIPRFYVNLDLYLRPGKVLVIYGARQVGKTTMLLNFIKNSNIKSKVISGEDITIQEIFNSRDFRKISSIVKGYELLAIDEAQKIEYIGESLKILVDQVPDLIVIATGSSSFELMGQIGEPLTGRKRTLVLYPVSQIELKEMYDNYDLQAKLEEFLIFGGYPEVICADDKKEKIRNLNEISGSYLLKDILELERVRGSKLLLDLLRLLAFQVGSEVSLNELGTQLGRDSKTIARYLDLLEKGFVIYNLRGFSRNLRKEITKKSKYYFYDLGIRNSIISNFNPLEVRDDIGKLWENFLFIERLKKQSYQEIYSNNYFWRTWDQQEVDLIEEREGKLFGYEFKWDARKVKAPKQFLSAYKEAEYMVINRENYLDFIT
jgi:uncharacterized protein